jgi:proteic killer suppression protein
LRITNALIRSLRSLGQKRGAASLFSHHAFAPYAGVRRQVAPRCAIRYTLSMIKSFKHKGLKLFFEKGKTSGIQTKHAKKLRMQLAAMHTAQDIDDINLPGFSLHQLEGGRSNIWSISVNGNWRVTFEFTDGNAYILNYEDYH